MNVGDSVRLKESEDLPKYLWGKFAKVVSIEGTTCYVEFEEPSQTPLGWFVEESYLEEKQNGS